MFKFMPKPRPHTRGHAQAEQPARASTAESATPRAAQGAGAAPGSAAEAARPPRIIIADRAEFIDALFRLQRGHVLVRPRAAREDERVNCMLDSGILYTAFEPLIRYGLISEYRNAEGFPNMRYYRLTISGRQFADQACQAWRQRPLLERLAVRLCG